MRRFLARAGRWEYTWAILIVAVLLAMHLSIIARPAEPVFDEQHYVGDARSVLQGQPTARPEHPPLGKLFVVLGIFVFGDNPLGWRFFSVLTGTAGIFLFYLICRRLNLSRNASVLGMSLLALENLTFVQASIAMLDVFMLFFMLLAFWLYLRGQYAISGVAIALASLAKLSGVLILPAILVHWLITGIWRRRQRKARVLPVSTTDGLDCSSSGEVGGESVLDGVMVAPDSDPGKRRSVGLLQVVILLLAAYAAFWVLLVPLNYVEFHKVTNPLADASRMLSLSDSLTFGSVTHPSASRPWEWVLKPLIMPYWYTPHYIGAISFTLWGLIVPVFGYTVFAAVRKSTAGLFSALWFFFTYVTWLPLSLLTDRISYVFYFYPAVGAVTMGAAQGISALLNLRKSGKLKWLLVAVTGLFLVLHVGVFALLSPLTDWWKYPV